MSESNPTAKESAPERIWLHNVERDGHRSWTQSAGHDDDDAEYVRVDPPPDCPTEAEAEAILRESGTSGKQVVNNFIEHLLRENLSLKSQLDARVSGDVGTGGVTIKVLRLCRSALASLLPETLGQDPEIGHFYRDELLTHVDKVLATPAVAGPTEEAGYALTMFREIYETVTHLGGSTIEVAVDSDLAKALLAAGRSAGPTEEALISLVAAKAAICFMCAKPERYKPAEAIEGSERLFHFQRENSREAEWNAGACLASALNRVPRTAAGEGIIAKTRAMRDSSLWNANGYNAALSNLLSELQACPRATREFEQCSNDVCAVERSAGAGQTPEGETT